MDTPSIPQKRCTKCGRLLPATTEHFNKINGGKYGLNSRCKPCVKIYSDQYRANNRDKISEYQKQWEKDNPDKVKAKWQKYRNANIIKIREGQRIRKRNSQKAKDYLKAYRQSDHGKNIQRLQAQRRRAKKLQAEGSHTYEQELEQYKRQSGKCYYCHKNVGDNWHPDHVIPLTRGGSDDISNIVIACPPCNLAKWAKMPHEWPDGGRLI